MLNGVDWKLVSRIALVGALSAIAYYYIEKNAKAVVGK